ncbi:OLC1v1013693C1 [Oldenlandia corymbosa var. corymbosa]|uniref:Bidirectional sugar transporter SWEET n=1 Tax=Oldenlandia corymbosa var. corymbosa TaxID=529605 RepID=A0AAV1DZ05_OLDCO|nr:OLC1v1013693C1 [Oldenlandia corymbosa var. corymbosa]
MALSSSELTFVFGLLGNIISFCVFLAPVPTFYQIFKKKSTEGFQSIPYVVALLSAMLWIYYALLKTNATFLITINTFGCFIELIYICFFLVYATKKARVDALKQIVGLLVCGFGLIVVLTYFLAHGATRVKAVGWTCLVFSLCVFVAPLCIVREVIRTKSAEYMPLPLSAFLTLNAVAWFFYGLLLKDFNIAIPNVLGFIFGILQIILYKIYSKSPKKEKELEQKKVPELADQIIILEDNKLSGNKNDQVIDIAKLSELEKIPVVLRSGGNNLDHGFDAPPRDLAIQMEPPKTPIVAAA